jgi:probable phosphoglycerate mutase
VVAKVIVEADGGSRGNPGPAGYGAVVWDAERAQVLAERKEALGVTTNNVAEYRGLIAGLAAAAELGAREVHVRMDSKLVVEQMSGRWKVKHAAMIPLAEQARRLVAGFDRVGFEWIPRERNSHADRLANQAMDDAITVAEPPTQDIPAVERPTPASPGWTGATGRPTRLLLLRHGQTELSVQRRYSGRGNPPLTALGREQADRAAKYLAAKGDIAAIVSSPLGRARETAEAVGRALGLPVRVLDGLIETDFGTWEGLTFAEAAQRDPELHARWLGDPSVPAPGGESFDQVRERVAGVRDDLLALYPERNVVVVSHVTPIKTMLQLALAVGPSLLYRLHLDLASLSIAEFYPDGGAGMRLANDTSYL